MTTHIPLSVNTSSVMRRTISHIARGLPLIAGAALLPLVSAAPAFAADHVICVGNPAGTCDEAAASIKAAILVANANLTDDTILVGPGTYSDGPYYLHGGMTLKGSGQGATFLTLPDLAGADEYVEVNGATVQDLTIKMSAVPSTSDTGLSLYNQATAIAVKVDGAGTQNTNGIEATNSAISMSAIQMPTDSDANGIRSEGGTTVADSTISGGSGFVRSGSNTADTLSRVSITVSGTGIWADAGTVNVDNAFIDLGSRPGIGLLAAAYAPNAAARTINANHVTIVGGSAGSKGAYAYAAYPNASQQATIHLANSNIHGPATSLAVIAGNNGAQGGLSTATITTSYSNWSSKSETIMPNGTAHVVVLPGNLDVDPAFRNAAGGDYRLKPGSPLVDHGDPAAAGPTLDLDGNARVVDSDGNGTSVRDMGAYEQLYVAPAPVVPTPAPVVPAPVASDTVAPGTRLTSKPAKVVTKATVKFRFKSNESGVTFTCKLDKRSWRPCTSPKKLKVKAGKHRFSVRATDAAGNTDATPATYRFKRVAQP